MKCTFCQKLTRPCEDDVQIAYQVYRCDYHRYVVKYYLDFVGNHCETTIFYQDYLVNFHMPEPDFGTEFTIQYRQPNTRPKTILTLPFHPNITPENIKDKLPTYLTFL